MGLGPLRGSAGSGFEHPGQGNAGGVDRAGLLTRGAEGQPRERRGRVGFEHAFQQFDGLGGPLQPRQDVGVPHARLDVLRVDLPGSAEVAFRAREIAALRQDERQVVLRVAVVVVDRDGLPEPGFGLFLLAEFDQRHADVEDGQRVVGHGFQSVEERRQRGARIALTHRGRSALDVRLAAHVQALQFDEERVREDDAEVVVQLQLPGRFLAAAETAEREAEVVMHDGAGRLPPERLLEALDRRLVVAAVEVDAPEAEPGRGTGRVALQNQAIVGLRFLHQPELEPDVGPVGQGREVVRHEADHAVERRHGFLERAFVAVVDRQVVGPSGIVRRQRLGVAERRGGGGHEVVQQV